MKSRILVSVIACVLLAGPAVAQGVVGRLKQKAAQIGENALDKKIDQKTGTGQPSGNTPGGTSGRSGAPANETGEGLIVTPPDVKASMADAETSFKAQQYADARFALRQAMLGVEMEIGHEVLKSLPKSVAGLSWIEDADEVTSMGWGWVGLTINREYEAGKKYLAVTIANNGAMLSAVNMYLSNPGYASSSGEQNMKQIKVKDHRGVIQYEQSTGYTVSVPIGQTSLIMWEGRNFASEQDILNAASAFDIDAIMKKLGEK